MYIYIYTPYKSIPHYLYIILQPQISNVLYSCIIITPQLIHINNN